jgi:hypothetical protein
MATRAITVTPGKKWGLSLDSWAVFAAFLAALLIRLGLLKHIPW